METIRTQADVVGNQLARALGELVSRIGGAQLGPKLLSERYDITVGTASRFLRAIAEPNPMDVMQDIPGPAPLKKFVESAKLSGMPAKRITAAVRAVDAFEDLIREFGGSRSGLNAVLSNWQPRGRKQFVLKRRQEAFKALSELSGVSTNLSFESFVLYPSAERDLLDMLKISGKLDISRTRSDAQLYIGTRRVATDGGVVPPHLHPLTLDGGSALDCMNSVRVDGFGRGSSAPIETKESDESIIHTLGPTGLTPDALVDFVTAEVTKPGARRRGPGFCEDPFHIFTVSSEPCRYFNMDLLVHKDARPAGMAELMVYSIVPLGPVVPGDPSRDHDLIDIPEALEIHSGSLHSLQMKEFPRYVELLEHSFQKLGWDMDEFTCWRLNVDFAPVGIQFCIRFG